MDEQIECKCNLCGRKFDMWDFKEGTTIEKQSGYGSRYDGELIKLKLCSSCLDNIIDTCKISPIQ